MSPPGSSDYQLLIGQALSVKDQTVQVLSSYQSNKHFVLKSL